jgi:BirA family biotin operon repressor/biotin-[acetyl-CoA-carboxylase] ligase
LYNIQVKHLIVGNYLIYLPECHSTNDVLSELSEKQELAEGTILITNNQTKGKGQRGNSWETSPEKNLTLSLLLLPQFLSPHLNFLLNIFVSLSLKDFFSTLGFEISIKWPNDIYYHRHKMAGILIQNTLRSKEIVSSIAGIGINVNQESFQVVHASSIYLESGKILDLNTVFNQLVEKLDQRYLQLREGRHEEMIREYTEHLYWLGHLHEFYDGAYFQGIIRGIDPQGKLLVERSGKMKSYDLKEIRFIS